MTPRHYMTPEGIAAVNAAGRAQMQRLRAARDSKAAEQVRAELADIWRKDLTWMEAPTDGRIRYD